VPHETTIEYFEDARTMPQLRRRLATLLKDCWKDSWQASPTQSVHNSTHTNHQRTHTSVHRLLFGVPAKKKRTNLASKASQAARKHNATRPLQQYTADPSRIRQKSKVRTLDRATGAPAGELREATVCR